MVERADVTRLSFNVAFEVDERRIKHLLLELATPGVTSEQFSSQLLRRLTGQTVSGRDAVKFSSPRFSVTALPGEQLLITALWGRPLHMARCWRIAHRGQTQFQEPALPAGLAITPLGHLVGEEIHISADSPWFARAVVDVVFVKPFGQFSWLLSDPNGPFFYLNRGYSEENDRRFSAIRWMMCDIVRAINQPAEKEAVQTKLSELVVLLPPYLNQFGLLGGHAADAANKVMVIVVGLQHWVEAALP